MREVPPFLISLPEHNSLATPTCFTTCSFLFTGTEVVYLSSSRSAEILVFPSIPSTCKAIKFLLFLSFYLYSRPYLLSFLADFINLAFLNAKLHLDCAAGVPYSIFPVFRIHSKEEALTFTSSIVRFRSPMAIS